MKNISFSPPDITEEEIAAVTEALRSGWITTGPRTAEFEKQIAGILRRGARSMLKFRYGRTRTLSARIGNRPGR